MTATATVAVPAVIRGRVVFDQPAPFVGRTGGAPFSTPAPSSILGELPLRDPTALRDLHALPLAELIDYLDELGRHLVLADNEHLQEALEHSAGWSDLTPPVLRAMYEQFTHLFTRDALIEIAESSIGLAHLDGWVDTTLADGRRAAIRAMGARTLHIIAGNSPWVAALSIIRNALTRSDAIIKTPSNDPLTATAIARTMCEMAPDHPLTRHLAVAYWEGGNTGVEEALYRPSNIEKIIAWGGMASVKHVTRYIGPGLELVALDPKHSATVIGPEAFGSDQELREVARRAALDIGAMNQLGCVNARVIYTASGLDPAGIDNACRLGELIYQQLQELPAAISTPAKQFDPELRGQLAALRATPDWYRVHGGDHGEGAIIVSLLDEPVDFFRSLSGRVANIVPIEHPTDVLRFVDTATQTVGVYPDTLKAELRDVLPLCGVQRLVSLGYAASPNLALPQDAIEPMRRMVKWIVDETCQPDAVTPLVTVRGTHPHGTGRT